MDKRRPTTKDIALLIQLRDSKQLTLAPEFQRASVWPRPAKAYLIDTILSDRPIPLLFFNRTINLQTNKPAYEVIDGQQRLNAVFQFYDNRFSLTESEDDAPWKGKRWKSLDEADKQTFLDYDFVVEELSGYSDWDVRDMFRRMNRYVVPLNVQEQRHAVAGGLFTAFVEEVGEWRFWTDKKIFSANAAKRRRTDEFAAEIAVLLLEGPQDKKKTLDLYFEAYSDDFPLRDEIRLRLLTYTEIIDRMLPSIGSMQLRRPVNFYALIGALDSVTEGGDEEKTLDLTVARDVLQRFDEELQSEEPGPIAARYLRAASRQTDNIGPRQTRIDTLARLLSGAVE